MPKKVVILWEKVVWQLETTPFYKGRKKYLYKSGRFKIVKGFPGQMNEWMDGKAVL
jgi:hypothetical protein